eukprot:6170338-Pleurochrysis_carterae.AAC.1
MRLLLHAALHTPITLASDALRQALRIGQNRALLSALSSDQMCATLTLCRYMLCQSDHDCAGRVRDTVVLGRTRQGGAAGARGCAALPLCPSASILSFWVLSLPGLFL